MRATGAIAPIDPQAAGDGENPAFTPGAFGLGRKGVFAGLGLGLLPDMSRSVARRPPRSGGRD